MNEFDRGKGRIRNARVKLYINKHDICNIAMAGGIKIFQSWKRRISRSFLALISMKPGGEDLILVPNDRY